MRPLYRKAASLLELVVVCVLVASVAVFALAYQRGSSETVLDEAAWQKLRASAEMQRSLYLNRGAYSEDPAVLSGQMRGVEYTNGAALTDAQISVGLIGTDVVMASPSQTGACLYTRLTAAGDRTEGSFVPAVAAECHYEVAGE